MRIGGFDFLTAASDGALMLVSYHPRNCTTWHWYVSYRKRNGNSMISRTPKEWRRGQWHDYYNFGRSCICVGRQDYHKQRANAA
jgi:hypothetical protein